MTTLLERTLSQVRAKIHRARMSQLLSDRLSLNDIECVSSQLVTPILSVLGWNVEDGEEVKSDYQLEALADGCGLALFLSGTPSLLIELRRKAQEFDQKRVIGELLPGASDAGFEWVLLTDGDDYDVYHAHAGLPTEHRPFDALRLSDDSMADALEFFDLFSKTRMEENRLESVWNRRLIDRKVRQLFEEVMSSDDALAQLLHRKTKDLSASEIRGSLARATIALQFESRDRPGCVCVAEGPRKVGRAARLSDAELRIATWLQRRSIERWAKGRATLTRSRRSQRRKHHRRSRADRRDSGQDRRIVRVVKATERRQQRERRSDERRRDLERRVTEDRRRVRRRA